MYTCGYVAIVGRANAGKSTLLNALIGEKVAIVSDKPQTTRNNILGIRNEKNSQIIFVDTPGIHHSKNHLDRFMMKSVRSALAGVDLILYLVDGSRLTDQEERDYIEKLKNEDCPLLILLTKSDKPLKTDVKADLTISSVKGENLDILLKEILKKLPKSAKKNFIFDEDYYTDRSVKFLVGEYIREEALRLLDKEIPHGIAVDITRFDEKNGITAVDADLICERDSHKGIIIGKGGQTLRKIGEGARKQAEELLGTKVVLKLFVKVEKDWRDKQSQLNSFGYTDKK